MRKPILALTAAAFGIGTTEFIIVGLLPGLAGDFHISIPRAGVLVTGYALSVTFGSPLVAISLGHLERKRALLILLAMFVLGNGFCALAPTFGWLLAARVLTALCHGAFFGIGSVLAANLVPRGERAQAIALMFTGLTLANILGVPAGTALGLAYGWRAAFWALIPIGLIATALLVWLVPSQTAVPTRLKHEIHMVLRLPVQLTLVMSTLSSVALFCVFTYIAPLLEFTTHMSAHAVTWVLVVFGFGITIGTLVGGKLSDWNQMAALLGLFGVLLLCFLAMPFTFPHAIPAVATVFVWGFLHFGAGAPLQPRIVEKANGANLASTLNQSAFNFGNALGASLGGYALLRGFGYRQLPFAGAVILVCVLAAALVAQRVDRREQQLSLASVPEAAF